MIRRFSKLVAAFTFLCSVAGMAHVNSPDVYFDGHAGPYHLLITVRPPQVVPGVAEVQVRSVDGDVDLIKVLPLRMIGPGAKMAPVADIAKKSTDDPQLFTGNLWIMVRGSWKVQVQASGKKGDAELAVPLPAVSTGSQPMRAGLGLLLGTLGLLLVGGLVGIVGAARSDAELAPGEQPSARQQLRRRTGVMFAIALLVGAVIFGKFWWAQDAQANAKLDYRQPHLQPALQGGSMLRVRLDNPNASQPTRFRTEQPDRLRLDDLIPDHGHLMHLFLVRMPDMKSFWHLHPNQDGADDFSQELPKVPAGHYQLYADIVHHTGFPETEIGAIDLPEIAGKLSGDDAGSADLSAAADTAPLGEGHRMVWLRDAATYQPKRPFYFRFRVEDKNGKPAQDMEPYMGMAGHAVFIRDDGSVFAHVHPAGSVAMAAVDLATQPTAMQGMDMADHLSTGEVMFPYGFPQPGSYHIFVQVKINGRVETAAFTADVR